MRVPRIYQPTDLKFGDLIQLNKEAANHVVNVLRLKVTAALIIFNGEGGEYAAEIIQIKRHTVTVKIKQFQNINRESNLKIHLAQSVSRGEKMDFILQKATELGVNEITPIITERCQIKLSKDRWSKKIDRWQKIIIGACEQCGRNILPQINFPTNFTDFVARNKTKTKIILDPNGSLSCRDLIVAFRKKQPNSLDPAINKLGYRMMTEEMNLVIKPRDDSICNISILVGPEGGFTEEEIGEAKKHNFLDIKLGPRILRTETAGIVITSILQVQFEF